MAPAGRQGHPKATIGTPKGDIVDHNRTTPSMEEDRIDYASCAAYLVDTPVYDAIPERDPCSNHRTPEEIFIDTLASKLIKSPTNTRYEEEVGPVQQTAESDQPRHKKSSSITNMVPTRRKKPLPDQSHE